MSNTVSRSNESIIVKELSERYDTNINIPSGRSRYKGNYTYQVRGAVLCKQYYIGMVYVHYSIQIFN